MILIPVLMGGIHPRGGLHSGWLLEDMPPGLLFTGKRGYAFTFEITSGLADQARQTEQPVALVDLDTLCAVEVKPGLEFPQIEQLPSVPN